MFPLSHFYAPTPNSAHGLKSSFVLVVVNVEANLLPLQEYLHCSSPERSFPHHLTSVRIILFLNRAQGTR